jgi:hypothetical protein
MQAWRTMLHKSHDIARTQSRECDSPIAKTVLEEIADDRHIVDDSCSCQRTCFSQVLFVFLCAALGRSQSIYRWLFGWNHLPAAQEVNQVFERGEISPARSHMSRAISQITDRVIGADAPYVDAILLKPSAKTYGDPDLPLQRLQAVPLRT